MVLSAEGRRDFRGEQLIRGRIWGGRGFGLILGCIGEGVNDLSGARVVQLFASFVLDRVRIALQVVDVLVQAVIFLLQLLHLDLEHFCFFALVSEGRKTVVAEDDAVGHHERQKGRREGSPAAAPQVDAVLRGSGELWQFDGELGFGWRGSQLRASFEGLRADRSLEVSRIRA
jgi:hypothetical protein